MRSERDSIITWPLIVPYATDCTCADVCWCVPYVFHQENSYLTSVHNQQIHK